MSDERLIHDNLSINEAGHLCFAGVDVVDIASEFGTPAYVLDEALIRKNCNIYKDAMKKHMPDGSMPLFASKALSFTEIYRIMKDEKMYIDVVSPGELYTADRAGFPLSQAFFHGSNKTDEDIALGFEKGIGYFVVDNEPELLEINRQARNRGIVQNIIMRITPGIDPHTHAKINTGRVDSKFGTPIETGAAEEFYKLVKHCRSVKLCGFHSHIGSQIFETTPFSDAAKIMIEFIAMLKEKYGFDTEYLNLGGGFGVRYVAEDPQIDYAERIEKLSRELRGHCEDHGIAMPKILLEPGRSIVAAAGLTLYSVGSVKKIEGFKNYVSIDGGMTDNPRYALYESPYTVCLANKMNEACNFECTIAGRCCESGDLIQENVHIPEPKRGDIVAVLCTGAYNYSMASNYNRIPRPPVLIVRDGEVRVGVRRERFDDLCALDA